MTLDVDRPVRLDPPAEPAAPPRSELWEAVRYVGLVVLTVRAALAGLTVLGLGLLPTLSGARDRFGRPTPAGWDAVLGAWQVWDANWYLRIVDRGYTPFTDPPVAWFPVYPLVARMFRPLVGGSVLGASLVVSHLAAFGALVLLYRLISAEQDRGTARKAVLFVAVSPVAFFLFAPYTESLFLLLAVLTFWAARRQRWWLAGLAGALASGTRSAGVLLALPVAIEALRALRAGGWRRGLPGLSSAALVPAGLLAYMGYWWVRRADALLPLRVQADGWGHEPWWPWRTMLEGYRQATERIAEYPHGYWQADFLIVVGALVLVVVALRTLPVAYSAWTLVSMLLPLSTPIPRHVMLSTPRYFLVLFPLAWVLARLADRWNAHLAVVGVSSGLMALLAVLHLTGHGIY
jgi:Mannosyltransferase (PIG-V)